ncbi:unnamed protein product [Parnassius apollo]|uniref:(apollo) hypothetical protein n=1 Tax=Parnassius apollo TaxID=110799 RepID=A0A8S3Y1T2_PARAO|nr:unnamed protein product [Parnassius apollo]
MILFLTVYGISLGYHFAQKELSAFAMGESESESGSESKILRSSEEVLNEPVVRLVAVNKSQGEQATDYISGLYETTPVIEPMFIETSATPIFVLESERPAKEPVLTPNERELARRLIGRFRRARRNNSTSISLLSPENNNTVTASYTNTLVTA